MRSSLSRLAVTLALGVALLGCGGDDEAPAEPASARTATTERDPTPAVVKPATKPPKKPAKKRPSTQAADEPKARAAPAAPPPAVLPRTSGGAKEEAKDAERKAKENPPILGGAPPDR